MMKKEVGEVRPGQLITTYGPGAIIDSVNDSLMVLDIKYWQNCDEKIYDNKLAKFLKKDYFKKIPATGSYDLPSIPFPNYHVCSKCFHLFDIRETFKMSTYLSKGPSCPDCSTKSYPARFVVSCQENHLDDFPWRWWVHNRKETECRGKLYLKSSGKNSSLESLYVQCECGERKTMRGATQESYFERFKCTGNHPHKLNKKSPCASAIIPLQRGASNVYFPALRSAIVIPDKGEELNELFISLNDEIEQFRKVLGSALGDQWYIKYYELNHLENRGFSNAGAFLEKFKKYQQRKNPDEEMEYNQIKQAEYHTFTNFKDKVNLGGVFQAEIEKVPIDLQPYFKKIIKAYRLKEILVLLGFMRNDSPEPDVNEPQKIVWLESNSNENWLPAVEVHGEGIFLEFNKESIASWIKNNQVLSNRSDKFSTLYSKWIESKGWELRDNKNIVYVMLHTFAHLLIKQLSLQSGYSSVAIKERIYCGEDMAGILLYTGSTDQEGSLGGLVEMGTIKKLRELILKALEDATFCSSDPYCASLEPCEDNHLNGCACFACSMVSETSCEVGNRLLDRSLVVKTIDSQFAPFFEGLI